MRRGAVDSFACSARSQATAGYAPKGTLLVRSGNGAVGWISEVRLLRRSIEQVATGQTPIMVLDRVTAAAMTGPASMDAIAPTEGWESYWREVDGKRRNGAPWARTAG